MSDSSTQTPPATGWQTFGHDAAVRMLDAANMSGQLSHAYLVTGPERVGRKTLAIDFACLVNCTPQPDLFGEAPRLDIGSSPPAVRIRKGHHADVRVINTRTPLKGDAENGGEEAEGATRQQISINHIHDLQRDAALKPFEGKARVFILDGAEAMSAAAANSLLKTLEEPSDDVYIVLVASDAGLLPETVVSRCQRINLRPVDREVIATQLAGKFGAEAAMAERLAKLSNGRPGWAIAALDDPAVLETYTQTALRILEAVSGGLEQRFNYARSLAERFRRDREGVLNELRRWQQWWRDVAVAKAGLHDNVINADWLDALAETAGRLSEGEIALAAGTVSHTITALEANAIPRLAIEVMMLEMPQVTLSGSAAPAAG